MIATLCSIPHGLEVPQLESIPTVELSRPHDRAAYKAFSLAELIELNLPEPEWIIEGLLPEGYSTVLSGPPKSGKGLLTIDMIASVAEGSSFLGRKVRKPGPVIYVSAEESITEVRSRILERVGGRNNLPIHVLPVDGFLDQDLDLANPIDIEKLIALVKEHGAVLVVLDVLRRLHNEKENESDSMSPIMDAVLKLCRTTGAAVVVNHHMNKGGTSRGSNAIDGGVDIVMALKPIEGGESRLRATFEAKGRSVPLSSLTISLEEDFSWTASESETFSNRKEPLLANRIVDLLGSYPGYATVPEIANALEVQESSVRPTISRMKKERPGLLQEKTLEGRGSPKAYKLDSPQEGTN